MVPLVEQRAWRPHNVAFTFGRRATHWSDLVAPVKLIRNLDEFPASLEHGAVTIGNFDGVHRGHALLLQRLVARARDVKGPAIVFTFDPHPAQLLYPEAVPPSLTWTQRKAELLGELGAVAVVAFATDRAVLRMSPNEFFQTIVRGHLKARAMVEGPNFFFGRDRSGSIDTLRTLCQEAEMVLDVVPPLQVAGRFVSSSWIRELIQAGDVRRADELLTRPYRVRGCIVQGAGRGAKIGFPTANIDPVGMVLPPLGVYAGRAIVNHRCYAAAVNIGPNPTFGEEQVKFEVHLVDCDQALYGSLLELDFLDRLRDIRSFDDVAALRQQLAMDVRAARQIASPL